MPCVVGEEMSRPVIAFGRLDALCIYGPGMFSLYRRHFEESVRPTGAFCRPDALGIDGLRMSSLLFWCSEVQVSASKAIECSRCAR